MRVIASWKPLTAVGRYVVCVEADILGFQVARLHSLGRHFGEHLETSTGCLEKTAGARSWGNISCQCEVNSQYTYIYIEFWLRFLLEARVSTVLCIFELQLETGTHRGWRISALVYMYSLSRQCSVLQCICNYICI